MKAYLRYELADTWGVITSRSDICHAKNGKSLFAASLERVAVWDVKQAVLVRHIHLYIHMWCIDIIGYFVTLCSFVLWMLQLLGLEKAGL